MAVIATSQATSPVITTTTTPVPEPTRSPPPTETTAQLPAWVDLVPVENITTRATPVTSATPMTVAPEVATPLPPVVVLQRPPVSSPRPPLATPEVTPYVAPPVAYARVDIVPLRSTEPPSIDQFMAQYRVKINNIVRGMPQVFPPRPTSPSPTVATTSTERTMPVTATPTVLPVQATELALLDTTASWASNI